MRFDINLEVYRTLLNFCGKKIDFLHFRKLNIFQKLSCFPSYRMLPCDFSVKNSRIEKFPDLIKETLIYHTYWRQSNRKCLLFSMNLLRIKKAMLEIFTENLRNVLALVSQENYLSSVKSTENILLYVEIPCPKALIPWNFR